MTKTAEGGVVRAYFQISHMPSEGDGLRDLLATYDDEKMMIKWWLWLW